MKPPPHKYQFVPVRKGSAVERCLICNAWRFAKWYLKSTPSIVEVPARP